MDAVSLLVDARCATGESPVWSVRDQALWWVDIPARALHRWSAQGHRHWTGEQMLACIAPSARHPGRFVAGMESGIFEIEPMPDGSLRAVLLAPVTHDEPGMRFNDGRCDRQGRLRVGSMQLDMARASRTGKLYAFDGDGAAPRVLQDDLIVPNGLAFSPDGRTMYYSDSHPQVQAIWACDYDIDTGMPGPRRLFVDMRPLPGRPDGAAIDVDGCYWICGNDAGQVHRFTPEGRLDRSIQLPVAKPAMCAFGGPDLRTLFVTSIRLAGPNDDQPLAGGVFAIDAGTQGIEEPACRLSSTGVSRQPPAEEET